MGVVYKYLDKKLNRIKALKVIHPRLLRSEQPVQRFRQEASISQELQQKNIVRVYAVTVSHRAMGEILEDTSLRNEVVGIMNEIYSISLKRSIRLPDGIVDFSLKKAMMFPRDTQTSLQRDINQKKDKNELELFGSTIIDLGRKLGIPTPTTKKIYRELEGI